MAQFERFIDGLIVREGGWQGQEADTGNYNRAGELVGTKYGIAAPTLEKWRGERVSERDMKKLSRDEAEKIYRAWYWDAMRASDYSDQEVANLVVDHGVNRGPGNAAKLLQSTLNILGEDLVVDGAIGPKTIAAINRVDQDSLHYAYKKARKEDYRKLGNDTYISGWLNRVDSFPNRIPDERARAKIDKIDFQQVADTRSVKKKSLVRSLLIAAIALILIGGGMYLYRKYKRQ